MRKYLDIFHYSLSSKDIYSSSPLIRLFIIGRKRRTGSGEFEQKEAKCPECGELMTNMGKDFKAPKKDNVKEWELRFIRLIFSDF